MATVTNTISAYPTSHDTTNISYYSVNSSHPVSYGYTDSNSTTYAQVHLTRNSNAETYVYYKFDFNDIPDNATVKSISAKAKGLVNNTSSTRVNVKQMQLCTGFSSNITFKGTALTMTTSATEQTFASVGTWTVSEVKDSGIRFYCKRGTSNTTTNYYMRMYGATMSVTYEYQEITYIVTSSLNGDGEIDPSGAVELDPGEEYTLAIVPANASDTVTATKNGSSITSSLVRVEDPGGTHSHAATAESFTTELSSANANFYTAASTIGTYFEDAIGHTAASPGRTSASETYVKDGGSNTATGWAWFEFDFSDIPPTATINSVSVQCYGFAASTTHDATHKANIQLYSGSTAKGSEQYFTSTSNSTITLSSPGTWTRDDLDEARLRFEVAYYGGGLFGITWTVNYTSQAGVYYTYTYTVNEDATIVVTITGGGSTTKIYFKNSGAWTAATKVYKKVNGSWVQQSDLTNVFNSTTNYVKG